MKGRIIIMSVLVSIINSTAFSQTEQNLAELPRVISAPPDAAGLGRYGNHTVGLFKGEANISIPIYEYKVGNLSVPISISYNTSGLKVDELASNVGLGWSLSAGGVITRTVKGQPDFKEKRRVPDLRTFDPNSLAAHWRTMDTIVLQNLDTEPDIYNFNFLGRSGKYVFSEDSVAICIPFQKLKIDRTPKIIDEYGIQYLFEKGEVSDSRDECSTGNPGGRDFSGIYPSSWYLSKIIHPNRDTIFLDYESYVYQYKTGVTQVQYFFTPTGNCASFSNMNRNCVNIKTVSAKRIKYITSNRSNFFVEFIYSTQQREDVYDIDNYDDYESKSLERVIVHDGAGTEIKKVNFVYSYFRSSTYSPSGTAEEKGLASRLKLLEVMDSSQAHPHKFEYIEDVNLPDRLSFSQDHYGYYNGKNNSTLIPSNSVLSYSGANREPDSIYMKANIIKKITYPTGGYTRFSFESNMGKRYIFDVSVVNKTKTINCNTGCHFITDSLELTENNGAYSTNFWLSYNLPDGENHSQGAIFGPDSFYMHLSGTETYDEIDPLGPGTYYFEIEKPTIVNGTFITLHWEERRDTFYLGNYVSGGLRTRQIIDSADINQKPVIKTFKYTKDGTDSSSLVDYRTFNYMSEYRKKVSSFDGNFCTGFPLCFAKVLSSSAEQSSYLDYSDFYGYQFVTEISGTENNNTGKVSNKFSLKANEFYFDDNSDKSDLLIDWSKGHLLESIEYGFNSGNQTYFPVRKTFSKYKAYYEERDYWDRPDSNYYTAKNEKFVSAFSYKRYQFGGQLMALGDLCFCVEEVYDPRSCTGTYTHLYQYPEFEIEPYFISSAWYHKFKDSTITYGLGTNDSLVEVSTYYHDSASHIQITRVERKDSEGKLLSTEFKYPHNQAGQAIYDTMIVRNMIANLIEQKKNTDGNLMNQQKAYFGFANSLIVRDSVQTAIKGETLKTEVKFDLYDSYGNILMLSSKTKPISSFIWDYANTLPIAEVINSSYSNIAYTSFEADGKGGWTFSGSASIHPTAVTGSRGYSLSGGNITKTGLTSGTTYIVTYWKRDSSSAVTVNSGSGTDVTTLNGWKLIRHEITGVTSLTISGTAFIDELRLFPKGAQITTFTHRPFVGITHQCDANNRVTYYEYDNYNRLKLIRDQDKNIIKRVDYKYQTTTAQQ